MKRHIHEIDIPDEIEFDAEFSDILIKRFESGKFTTESLYKMCNSSRRLIHLLGTFENDTEEEKELVYRHLYLFLQAVSNLYSMAQTDKETVDISVDDLSGSVSTSAYEDYIGINSWLDGYLFALAGREKNTIKLLAFCPEKELRTGDSSADDFFYSYIEFLKSVTSPDAEVLLNKVFVQCKTAKIAPRELIDHLILPQLELWKAILTKSVTDFNQKLEAAVIKHHAYWSQKVELGHQSYRCNSPDSLLAMRLAGIASFAHDHGIEVNYRSEYLPEFIIQNYLTVDAKVRFPEEVEK